MIERKFRMYAWPFQAARNLDFFADPSSAVREELKTAIREDLARFLPPELLAVHQADGYASFLAALQSLFAELRKAEVALPSARLRPTNPAAQNVSVTSLPSSRVIPPVRNGAGASAE